MKKKLLTNSFPKKKFNSKEKISKLKKELILEGFSCQKIRGGNQNKNKNHQIHIFGLIV